MNTLKLVLVALLFIVSLVFAQAQNYDPSFFPIGVWSVKGDFRSVEDYLYQEENGQFVMPAAAPALHQELFTDLAANGFNAAFMSLDPIGPTLHSILDTAYGHNIKIIASMQHLGELIGDSNDNPPTGQQIREAILNDSIMLLKNSPAVLGYYVYDEPLPGWIDFDKLKEAKDTLLSLTGGNHPILSGWNDVKHMDYIDSYLNLDVLMADIYPFSDSTTFGSLIDYMPAYFSDYGDPNDPGSIGPATPSYSEYIDQIRKDHCNPDNNRPMWIIFQSFGDAVQYDPDDADWAFWRQVQPKELRLQVWTALMHGAKGLWYFLYEAEHPELLGLLDVSGQPTARLTEASAINAQVNKISDILLKLDVVEDAQLTVSQGEALLHDDLSANTDDKYVIVANTDYANAQDIQVVIQKSAIGYTVNSIVDKVTDANIPFTETANTIEFTASLSRADGSLYHISAQNPLPVEMVSFSGYKFNNGVKLIWTTLSEKNNAGFIIERSKDGVTWDRLGFVSGQIDANSTSNYSFVDTRPINGINYYRLKQRDLDGFSEYSKIVQVLFEGKELGFYPNPANQTIHFLTHGKSLEKIQIFNNIGQLIYDAIPDDNYLDISFLDKGSYLVFGYAGNQYLRKQLIIAR